MKKYNLKLIALSLLATVMISSCAVQSRSRRPPKRDRHDRHDRHRDDRRRGNDHYYNHY